MNQIFGNLPETQSEFSQRLDSVKLGATALGNLQVKIPALFAAVAPRQIGIEDGPRRESGEILNRVNEDGIPGNSLRILAARQ